ncbi:MAG: FliI/YscN family ATPase [Hyphomicrobiaceae bacterium]
MSPEAINSSAMRFVQRTSEDSDHAPSELVEVAGRVHAITATHCVVKGLSRHVALRDLVSISRNGTDQLFEVIGVDDLMVKIKALDSHVAVMIGDIVWHRGPLRLRPGDDWKGRSVDAIGQPIDGQPLPKPGRFSCSTNISPPDPLGRSRSQKYVATGVRAIDIFTPLSEGQRIGIFAGSGVGKSTLLGMLADSSSFDVVVLALVGERGHEAKEFLDQILGENRDNVIAVIATSDQSALKRRLAPRTAMTIAEHFCNEGARVLLLFDSITRFAHAERDVALAAGEPPVSRGYPPSVFSSMASLLERAGMASTSQGSITAVVTVLVDGDDFNDPVSDAARGFLDGHIILDRSIASEGRFPAINILNSTSRMADRIWTTEQSKMARKMKALLSRYEETRDLRSMGAYQAGADQELDNAVLISPKIYDALCQTPRDPKDSDPYNTFLEMIAK